MTTKPDILFTVKMYKDKTKDDLIKIDFQPGCEQEVISLLVSLSSKELYHSTLHELHNMITLSPEMEKSIQFIFDSILTILNNRKEQPAILASQTFKKMR